MDMADQGKTSRRFAKVYIRRLINWTDRFKDSTILVVGDLIVDEYVWGDVERISPEAPVPVVKVNERGLRLGGAANVVNNLRSLGAKVLVCGVVGNDQEGRWMVEELKGKGIPIGGIFAQGDRPSTLKTRIIANNQQVVRIDREDPTPIGKPQIEALGDYIVKKAPQVDAIIVSDYGKGVVVAELMEVIRGIKERDGTIVAIDPKVNHFSLYCGVTAVTPNHLEAARAAGMDISCEGDLLKIGRNLLQQLGCEFLLITRGEEGMSLFHNRGEHLHIPTVAKEVYDVTGAGDTVISTFTLALSVGADPMEAALLANLSAGIVVGEVGTATVSKRRLQRVLKGVDRLP